jgi:AraC family transcriptional regulator
MLLHELLRLSRGTGSVATHHGGLASWQQNRVAAYIDEHLGQRISLADLAGIARLSRFHFARAFKQSFGVPPHRYHRHRRIDRAMELLAHSRHTVTEIALKVGFSESSAFATAFRRTTGLAPSEYRRAIT